MEEEKTMEREYRELIKRREETMTVNVNGERLNEDFSESPEQLLQKNAIERGRLIRRKHKQEKRWELTQGQECSARRKG
jgi:hypothetical protein